jgi:glycosyltransferase involved in cell wall biosynthesis
MKVLQTIPSLTTRYGGQASSVAQLFESLSLLDNEIKLLAMASKEDDVNAEVIDAGAPWLINLPYDYKTPFAISKNMHHFLQASDAEIFHTNGLWLDINHATCAVARKKQRPYIISAHGMLYRKALRRSRWKKVPMSFLYFNKDILSANCIHVTCEQEMEEVRQYDYQGPIAVIPNPVAMPAFLDDVIAAQAEADRRQSEEDSTLRIIGYLGRLHPRKHVELIFQGLALLEHRDRVRVVVMGSGDEAYERFLHDEVERLHLNNVEFAGFVTGREKYEKLARLSALFVPSDMENFGMIVPEALSVNTPVMASLGTPWEILSRDNSGWWTEASPESIAAVIKKVLTLPIAELRAMGNRGRRHVVEAYNPLNIAKDMLRLYSWLLGKTEKPEFVYEN